MRAAARRLCPRGRCASLWTAAVWLVALGLIPGCSGAAPGWRLVSEPVPAAEEAADVETVFAAESSARTRPHAAPLKPPLLNVVIDVLHVEVPRPQLAAVRPVWRLLSEDRIDAQTALRLRRNGLRAGVGQREWWPTVSALLNEIPDVRSHAHEPMRLPAGFPIALELESAPREHTIFTMSDDGVLSGETWPDSLPVLRLTQTPLGDSARRVRFEFVPEVRQARAGLRWVRTDAGVAQTPEYHGRAYGGASFTIDLAADEFLLIAPSETAQVFGILGGVLLSRMDDEAAYDSFIFLRPDIRDVAQRQP